MAVQPLIIRSARDVVDAVNSGAVRGGNEVAIVIIALGGIFIDAYDFTSVAFGLKDITATFHIDAWRLVTTLVLSSRSSVSITSTMGKGAPGK